MADLVIMPKTDWVNALDATRAKTGKTDLILSKNLADEILSITTSEEIPSGTPITSEEEFSAMKEDGDYYLANDITVSNSYDTFRGRLHGNGKTVTVSEPLFEKLEGASVCDLTIKGTVNRPTSAQVGALACLATTANTYRVVNEANVSGREYVGGLIGYAYDTCVFWGCLNTGKVFSKQNAAGILAYGKKDATFTHCGNAGDITVSSSTSTDDGASFAAGIVSWVGGTGIIYYCVNLGEISGNRPVAGIGGRFGETDSVNGHIVFGCVNMGQIHTSSGNVAGLVKRTYGRSEFNNNIVSGSLKTDDGVVSGIIDYNTSSDTDYSNNVIMLDQDSVAGTSTYVVCANTGSSLSVNDSNFRDIYILKGGEYHSFEYFFKRKSGSSYSIPSSYDYYYTRDELIDGLLIEVLGNDFVMENQIPMHRGVVGTYRLAREMLKVPTATFEVNFIMIDDVPRSSDGYYVIDEGVEVYFEGCNDLIIEEGLFVGSSVRIFIDCEDITALYVTYTDGCVWDEDVAFMFNIESENASAAILEEYN